MHIESEVFLVCCKTPLHGHKFSNWCTVLERFSFYQVLFFSCVRLISFLVVSAKMSGLKICRIKLHRRPRKEIRISAQVWFQAVNGLCLAEFKKWPSGQMGDKFSPIFRSLRLAARHVDVPSVFSWAPKLTRNCESKQWFPCGADGWAPGRSGGRTATWPLRHCQNFLDE